MGIKPLAGHYAIGKARLYFRPEGQDAFRELGDADEVTVEIEYEDKERKSNQYGTAKLVSSVVVSTSATISLTLMQQTAENLALAMGSDPVPLGQSAVTAAEHTVTGVRAGGIYDLPHLSVTVAAVTDGSATPVPYTAGVHYEYDPDIGLLRVIATPAGAGPDLHITYAAAAISDTSGRVSLGLASNNDVRGQLRVHSIGDVGPRSVTTLWDVQLRPSGGREYISDDYVGIKVTGKVFADPSQPPEYQYGREVTL